MRERGIACGIHYKACHNQKLFHPWDDRHQSLPLSEQEEISTVSLPFHEKLTTSEIIRVIKNAKELANN